MNKECCGLFGKIFGHKFVKYLVKEKYIQEPNISFNIYGSENAMKFMDSQRDEFIIRCKRCGNKPIEEE